MLGAGYHLPWTYPHASGVHLLGLPSYLKLSWPVKNCQCKSPKFLLIRASSRFCLRAAPTQRGGSGKECNYHSGWGACRGVGRSRNSCPPGCRRQGDCRTEWLGPGQRGCCAQEHCVRHSCDRLAICCPPHTHPHVHAGAHTHTYPPTHTLLPMVWWLGARAQAPHRLDSDPGYAT